MKQNNTKEVVTNATTSKPYKERVINNSLPYKIIEIKTKIGDKEIKGSSIKVLDTVTFTELETILTKREMVEMIRLSLNIAINNADRNVLKPQNSPVDKVKKLINKGLSEEEKQELIRMLQ